jgi:hypothetical protein
MIRNDTVERALHHWEPWLNAVEEARTSLKNSDKETRWSYAGAVLRTMGLPTKSSLRVYFLSCVFSSYKRGDTYVFGELRVPPELKGKSFPNRGIGYKQDVSCLSPLPPAILTRKDVENLLRDPRYSDIFRRSLGKKEVRKFYMSRFILLNQEHPLRQIASKMKRYVNSDIAVACAKMKESMTYPQLGDRFGWAIQKDAHGKSNRCSTAHRYVLLGRKLISASVPKE